MYKCGEFLHNYDFYFTNLSVQNSLNPGYQECAVGEATEGVIVKPVQGFDFPGFNLGYF